MKYDRITPVEYGGLQAAYDHFNAELFDGSLPPDVFITYQRKARSHGYFAADRFSGRGGGERRHHELALNPDAFIGMPPEEPFGVDINFVEPVGTRAEIEASLRALEPPACDPAGAPGPAPDAPSLTEGGDELRGVGPLSSEEQTNE
jgi:hypothetical protein